MGRKLNKMEHKQYFVIEEVEQCIQEGKYAKAAQRLLQMNEMTEEKEMFDNQYIFYSWDWDKFFEGMCCAASADDCMSGCGGCSGCGGILCASFCICSCCTGGSPGQGCDCVMSTSENCCCMDILFGNMCDPCY